MGWASIKANWRQACGRLRMRWGRWTDDQLEVIEGRRELLLGRLQEAYGATAEEAERQVRAWEGQSSPDEGTGSDPSSSRQSE
jgi:uncharacterized protein YjbJ (UPF0337 family)